MHDIKEKISGHSKRIFSSSLSLIVIGRFKWRKNPYKMKYPITGFLNPGSAQPNQTQQNGLLIGLEYIAKNAFQSKST